VFQGLNTSLSALYSSRLALETTGNNIANVNTEGYSRQRVRQSEINNSFVSFHGNDSNVGVGVRVEDITRLRDQFLEARGLTEHSRTEEFQRAADTLATIELAFGEPGENGLQNQLSEFWSSWDKLASNPGDLATRSQVLELGQSVVSNFTQASSALTSLTANSMSVLKSDVDQINAMAQNIADLNLAIQSDTNAGNSPNALLDQRDRLIAGISKLAGVTVQPTKAGSVAVLVNGYALVRDDRAVRLQVDDSGSPVQLRWDGDNDATTTNEGNPALVTSGDIGGLMTTISGTVPKYRALLDGVAAKFISTVNAQHTAGQDKNGVAGLNFFTGTNAASIAVNPVVAADPQRIAAATLGAGSLDAENARKMADLANLVSGADSDYRQLINILGTESQRSTRQYETQNSITNSVDAARDSVSGVSLDEEMTNMVRFQHSYNAAAKYLTVLNDTMDSLMGMIR